MSDARFDAGDRAVLLIDSGFSGRTAMLVTVHGVDGDGLVTIDEDRDRTFRESDGQNVENDKMLDAREELVPLRDQNWEPVKW